MNNILVGTWHFAPLTLSDTVLVAKSAVRYDSEWLTELLATGASVTGPDVRHAHECLSESVAALREVENMR